MHGVEQGFVLHADIQTQLLTSLSEHAQHFFAALRAAAGIHQDNHGEIFAHELLADIEDVDLVFGQEFGYVVNDTDAVFADNGEYGMGAGLGHSHSISV